MAVWRDRADTAMLEAQCAGGHIAAAEYPAGLGRNVVIGIIRRLTAEEKSALMTVTHHQDRSVQQSERYSKCLNHRISTL